MGIVLSILFWNILYVLYVHTEEKECKLQPDSEFSTYLAITTKKQTCLNLSRYQVYLTMTLYKNQLCIRKTWIQDYAFYRLRKEK